MKYTKELFILLNILGLSLLTCGCKIHSISAELQAEGKTTASLNRQTSDESNITADIPDDGNIDDLAINFLLNEEQEADDFTLAGTRILRERSIEPKTHPFNLLPSPFWS